MKTMFVFLIILISFIETLAFKCGHDKIFHNRTVHPLPVKFNEINSQSFASSSNDYLDINIYVDYTSINVKKLVDEAYIEHLKKGLEKTKKAFSSLIGVNTHYIMTFDQVYLHQCDSNLILSQEMKEGVSADLVLLPIVVSESTLGVGVIAAAGACLSAPTKDNRPVVGIVYLGANYDFSQENSDTYMAEILFHEITHVLVFSPNLFDYFPEDSKPVTEIVEWNGQKRTVVCSPKVLKVAKKYFDCSSMEGVELEDQGGTGSAGAHWESRVMLGDYMVSSDYRERAISEITLALFEDSGWYKVNYYTGGIFRYGEYRGCDFIDNKCIIDERSTFDEFCTESSQPMCYPGHLSKGICNLQTSIPDIPSKYQYWKDTTKGGFGPADYCPVAFHRRAQDEDYKFNVHCEYGKPYNNTPYGETLGNTSTCFMSSLVKDGSQGLSTLKPICHSVTCSKNSYTITIEGNNITCDEDTKSVKVPGYSGEIQCVDINRVCTGTTFCNDIYSCIEAKSLSTEGLKGTYIKVSYLY